MNDRNMMSGQTPRTVKSRIEIDANENNVNSKVNLENEQNETIIKNKIFMTDYKSSYETKDVFSFHDLIIPNSKTAKIVINTNNYFSLKNTLIFSNKNRSYYFILVHNQRYSKQKPPIN